MIRFFTLLILLFVSFHLAAQNNSDINKAYLLADGRYLALDVYRFGRITRHRFFVGDELTFKLKNSRQRYRESLVAISDSSFTFANFNDILKENLYTEVKLHEVRKIRIYRRIPWVTQGAYLLPVAGGLFLLTDTFIYRGGIEFQVQFDPKSALIGGGIASLGILCKQLSFPSYRLKHNRLHVLRAK
ncbi:MAG: hypothetical protein U0X91_26920 [Spirosomataceae bacterium]